MNDYIINLKKFIANGDLKSAISELRIFAKEAPQLNRVILQSARLSTLSKDLHDGVIRFDDIQIERNKITKALLSLIDEIDFEIRNNKQLKKEIDLFLLSYQELKTEEQKMSPEQKRKRFQHFDNYDKLMSTKLPEERFKLQKLNSEVYLRNFGLSVKTLKEKLTTLNYYSGEVDNEFTRELANSLEMFQIDNSMRHIDGFFGELTYDMIVLRLKESEFSEE